MYANEELMKQAQTLRQPNRLADCGSAAIGNACREISAKEMLMSKAEDLRREAHELETLARELPPDGAMSRNAEITLRNTIAVRLYR